jgi:hypothetical protein
VSLTTLQQRIHRARTEVVMDELYDEAGQFYIDEEISYNVAYAFWRELNKRFWNAFKTSTVHYDFFSEQPVEGNILMEDGGTILLEDDSGVILED